MEPSFKPSSSPKGLGLRLLGTQPSYFSLPLLSLLALVAYNVTSGPWRTLWVKFGYDPREDPSSKVYQCMDFRLPKEVDSVEARRKMGVQSQPGMVSNCMVLFYLLLIHASSQVIVQCRFCLCEHIRMPVKTASAVIQHCGTSFRLLEQTSGRGGQHQTD